MSYHFRDARRTEAKPLIGLYAESGCGKTYSSLLLARGFAGPDGIVGMIDTESGRGEAFQDIIPGGYKVIEPPLRENFSPKAYGEAITAAEKAGLHALILDSASHEWEGAGGVLDMAAQNQAEGKRGPIVWQAPKMQHQRNFILRLLQTPIPLVIVCLRAKYPMIELKKSDGSKEWIRSDKLAAIQSEQFLYEMFVHAWIDQQHCLHVTKLTHPALASVFEDGKPITLSTGQRLSVWSRVSVPSGEPHVPPEGRAAAAAQAEIAAAAPITSDEINQHYKPGLEVAAKQGTRPMMDYWSSLPRDVQRILEHEKNRLKPLAVQADKRASPR